ncbi:MAG: molybdopterin-binding protein [Maritimibacter sp.]
MEFGRVPSDEAVGAILAHSVVLPEGRLRKGLVLSESDVAALKAAGIAQVMAARPGPEDIGEDEAAQLIADALVPDPAAVGLRFGRAATGRVRIFADQIGLARLDVDKIHALNLSSDLVSIATVPPWHRMAAGGMVATVKVIPYAMARDQAEAAASAGAGALALAPITISDAELIVTCCEDVKSSEDSGTGHGAIEARLTALGMTLARVREVDHEIGALAEAITSASAGMVLVLSASATSDLEDVGPEALRRAGGTVTRVGMPTDPGNLLFYGKTADGRPLIGLPGCARSPAMNGVDWVLDRLAAGLDLPPEEVARMGVGGLLK